MSNLAHNWVNLLQEILRIEDKKTRGQIIKNFRKDLQLLKNEKHILNIKFDKETHNDEEK